MQGAQRPTGRGPYKNEISYSVGSSLVGRKACQQVYSVVRKRTMVARAGDRQPWEWCAFLLLGLPGYSLRVLVSQL